MTDFSRKAQILDNVADAVSTLILYDREGDESLPVGSVEDAVKKGEITIDEIVEQFRKDLTYAMTFPATPDLGDNPPQ